MKRLLVASIAAGALVLAAGRSDRLSDRRRRRLGRVALEVCPPDAGALGLVDRMIDGVAATAAVMSPVARWALLVGIDLTFLGSRAPALLRRGLRDVLVVAYFDQPEVKRRLGYDPDAWTAETAARWQADWSGAMDAHRRLLVAPGPPPPPLPR